MPFREIYPWLARALSPGCWFCCHYLAMSASGKKREKKTEDFLVLLIGMREGRRKKEKKKQTHARTSLIAFFWRSPFMVSSQI